MNVQLTAASPRLTVSAADDPYKKYWWLILAGFILTGAWLCLPGMEGSVGSAHVDTSKAAPDPKSEQNLDSVDNPNGALGGALDLSMDGSKKRKNKDAESFESMLYQAAPDAGAAAAGAPLGTASGSVNLAQQLKTVAAASARKDESGWTEKARAGFAAPRLNGAGLPGSGSTSGGSSASAGGSAFGSSNAQVSYGSTHGLKDDDSEKGPAGGLQALRTVAKTAGLAAAARSNDTARAGVGSVFDGSKGRNAVIAGAAGGGGAYAMLDEAPANLKLNNPDLNTKEITEPPATPVPTAAPDQTKQMIMMMATMAIGGIMGGGAGSAMMMAAMTMMNQQSSKAEASAKADSEAAAKRMGGVTGK